MLAEIKKIISENYTDIYTETDNENSLRVALRENYWIDFFVKNENMVMSLLLWKNFEDFPIYGEMGEYQARMEKYLETNHLSPKNKIVHSGGYFYVEQTIINTENLKENLDAIMSLANTLHYL